MSYLYGPYTPTTGTLSSENVDQAAVAIRVTNDSPNDLWIDFGPSRPAVPSPLVSAAAFDAVVQAWSSQVLSIPGPYPNNTWAGIVWLLPVAGGGLAASGTISSRGNVYLTTYAEGEDAGTNHAVSRQADATSQQRIISIPTEPHINGQFGVNLSSGLAARGNVAGMPSGLTFNSTQQVTFYLYGVDMGLEGIAYGEVFLYILELNNALAIIASHVWAKVFVRAEQPRPFPPSLSPLPLQFAPLATCKAFDFGANITNEFPAHNQTVIAPQLIGTVLLDVDLTGQTPPPAIGNGAATPTGAIY